MATATTLPVLDLSMLDQGDEAAYGVVLGRQARQFAVAGQDLRRAVFGAAGDAARAGIAVIGADDAERKTPLELLGELYEKQNGQALGGEQARFAAEMIERIWEGQA